MHKNNSSKDALIQLTSTTQQFMIKIKSGFQNETTSIKNLETQVGQIASIVINLPQWTLPSDTKHILKNAGEEHYEAIMIGSEKSLVKLLNSLHHLSLLKKKI